MVPESSNERQTATYGIQLAVRRPTNARLYALSSGGVNLFVIVVKFNPNNKYQQPTASKPLQSESAASLGNSTTADCISSSIDAENIIKTDNGRKRLVVAVAASVSSVISSSPQPLHDSNDGHGGRGWSRLAYLALHTITAAAVTIDAASSSSILSQ